MIFLIFSRPFFLLLLLAIYPLFLGVPLMLLSCRQSTSGLWRRLHPQLGLASRRHPFPLAHLGVMASTCTDPSGSAAAAGGASTTSSYSTAVSKIPGRSSLPDEATLNPHHIIKAGRVSGFKNPYPSWSNPANLTSILKNVVW